ncbi:hypothetical protein AC1031_002620 [Aphanomyces cochlioides]|nr:hypothetical protein AC1031_002620 [Aphanomyces cochlioides]
MGTITLRKILGHRIVAIPDASTLVGRAIVMALQEQNDVSVVIQAGIPPGAPAEVTKALRCLSRVSLVPLAPGDAVGLRRFLSGAHVVFIVPSWASLSATRQLLSLAHDLAVPHIVLQSWLLAEQPTTATDADSTPPNAIRQLETHLQDLRPIHSQCTIVRLPFLLDLLVLDQNSLRLAKQVVAGLTPTARVPVLGLDDAVAALSAILLHSEAHGGLTYNLTHPQSTQSMAEMVAALSTALNCSISYRQVGPATWANCWVAAGAPLWFAPYTTVLAMQPDDLDDDVICTRMRCITTLTCDAERLLGRPPTSPGMWWHHPRDLQAAPAPPARFFVVGLNERLGALVASALVNGDNTTVRGCDNLLGTNAVPNGVPGVDWVEGQLERARDVKKMLAQTDIVVLLPSRATAVTVLPSLLRGAKQAKVAGVVLLSHEFAGSPAWDSPFQKHKHAEGLLQRSDLAHCVLRIPLLMEATLDLRKVVRRHRHRLPCAKDDCVLAVVAAEDVARALALAARQFPLHEGRLYADLRGDCVRWGDLKEAIGISTVPIADPAPEIDGVLAELGDVGLAYWSAFHFVDYVHWCDTAVEGRSPGGPSIAWTLAFNEPPLSFAEWCGRHAENLTT